MHSPHLPGKTRARQPHTDPEGGSRACNWRRGRFVTVRLADRRPQKLSNFSRVEKVNTPSS